MMSGFYLVIIERRVTLSSILYGDVAGDDEA